jgi:hypothetical protein
VIARVVGSMTEFKQIIGRGTRVRDDYGKLWFNILDYTGSATQRFADPEFDGDPAFISQEEIDAAGETIKEKINVVQEFASRLGLGRWEQGRTHWAIKDGSIPKAVLAKLARSYDLVFSFAGEDRKYVEQVAKYLRSKDVKLFYDRFEEVSLWGKDLAEHFDSVYRRSGKYCIIFISKYYAEKMWTRHERRAALARALREREEYILPARFDATELPGILPTVGYISLSDKSPIDFGKLILEKLGRNLKLANRRKRIGE